MTLFKFYMFAKLYFLGRNLIFAQNYACNIEKRKDLPKKPQLEQLTSFLLKIVGLTSLELGKG